MGLASEWAELRSELQTGSKDALSRLCVLVARLPVWELLGPEGEDALQETLTALLHHLRDERRRRGFVRIDDVQGYVAAMIQNLERNRRRKEARLRRAVEGFRRGVAAARLAGNATSNSELSDAVRAALQNLTNVERTCIELQITGGLNIFEISQRLSNPPRSRTPLAINSILKRARAKLRWTLRRYSRASADA